ncbi:hypothetical protein E2C01_051209 [Portunus trituberculatus]|uniref:Uncharacterized protein n=1 Tax=Portunus trituberculatus TaxID=210409 RepID=A0A5B7GE50_PORTR|nr:hypothetical protein [Portunus trituberculatus]
MELRPSLPRPQHITGAFH